MIQFDFSCYDDRPKNAIECLDLLASWFRDNYEDSDPIPSDLKEFSEEVKQLQFENASMIAAAADALGTDPEYRSAGCVDALVGHYEEVKAENATLRETVTRLTPELFQAQAKSSRLEARCEDLQDEVAKRDHQIEVINADLREENKRLEYRIKELQNCLDNIDGDTRYSTLRERLARLVEAAKSMIALSICLLGDGMTEETQPIEVRNLNEAIAAAEYE
jgi:chromosome segregation ATPase